MSSTTTADPIRDAYGPFASFYDAFTEHHDERAWTAPLEGVARSAGLPDHRLLDLGSGTGRSFVYGSRPDGAFDPALDESTHVKAVYVARRERA